MKMKLLAYAIASLGVAGVSSAYADDAAKATEKLERIEVTGTNIKSLNKVGTTAVEVIKRTDIEKTGATTVVDLLGKLPSVNVNLSGDNSSSFATGASAASLRGLGEKNTLVLLNGRRLANYGFANGAENTFVDLNSIPLSAIEQVEILRDGASAIYGSDAVAGVINFKTKRNYQGIEGVATTGINQNGDKGIFSGSLTAGFGSLDDDGHNVLLTLDAYHREPALSGKHNATKSADKRYLGGNYGGTTNMYNGSARDYTRAFPGFALPGCQGTVELDTDTGDNVCRTTQTSQLSPRLDRFGFSAIGTQRLGGQNELFAEVGVNHNVSTYGRGYPYFEASHLTPTAGSTNPAVQNPIPGAFIPGDTLQIFRAVYENGPQIETVTSNTYRFVGGWRGDIGNWDSEGSVNLNLNKVTQRTTNQLIKDYGNASLDAGVGGDPDGYNPFIPWNSADVVKPMLTDTTRRATSKLLSAEWKMSNSSLAHLPAGDVGFAWGLQVSHESMEDNPDEMVVADNISNLGGTASKGSRTVTSVYGEFRIPVLKNLEFQVAARSDHYSDFGDTVNPKIAFRYQPIPEVVLHGSATSTFKAPTLPEMYSTTKGYSSEGLKDTLSCVPLGYVGSQCAYFPVLYSVGNPKLNPEKSNNFSFGISVEPVKNLTASLDWYQIRQRGTIQSLDAQYVLDNEFNGYQSYITRDPISPIRLQKHVPVGRLYSMNLPYMNVGRTEVQGLDLDLSYSLSLGSYGKLSFREVNSYTLQYKQSTVQNMPMTDRLDSYSHPRWSNSFRTTYDLAGHSISATARTQAGTKNIYDKATSSQDWTGVADRLPSYTVWDLAYSVAPIKGMRVTMGINNAFNKKPIFSNAGSINDFIQGGDDLLGRSFFATVNYKFK